MDCWLLSSIACESSRAFINSENNYIMAKVYNNDKGFLIIEMSYEEAKNVCEFDITQINKDTGEIIGHSLLCDTCNNEVTDNIYYVAVLNRALCKECCDDFINNISRYKDDIPYEVRNYYYYARKLNLDKV